MTIDRTKQKKVRGRGGPGGWVTAPLPPIFPPEPAPKARKTASKVRDAKIPLGFDIGPEAVSKAVCRDPLRCVIAEAMNMALGDMYDSVEVGPAVTKVFFPGGRIVRYRTPMVLKDALTRFDGTGKWGLPKGRYELQAMPPSMRLGARLGRPNGRGRGNTKAPTTRRLPSRRVSRVSARG